MRAWSAAIGGMRRALASPFVLLTFWLVNLLVALPAAWLVQEAIRSEIGHSGIYKKLTNGFDMEWFGLFEQRARGMAASVTPTHSGMGGYLDNFEALLTGAIFKSHWSLLLLAAIFGLCWLTLLGGAIERYCGRGPAFAPFQFVGSGARYLFRLLRLTSISAPLYIGVFWSAHWAMKWMKRSTLDVTLEGAILFYSLLIWLAAGFLLTWIHAVFGFAKVAIVADGRRSAFLAAVRGLWLVLLHPAKTMGLYYLLLLPGLIGALAFSVIAPGATANSPAAVAWAFALSQLFLMFKLTLRISLIAGQVALYRAHAMPASATADEPPAGSR